MMDLTQLMHAAEEILREDGERILAMKGPEVFTKEGHANFVTSADLESQRFLVERLTPLLPGANFFAEEKEDNALAPGFNWLIDPIDGTTNFMRGYRHSAISVGLVQDGRGVMGLVYNPYSGELFSALRGAGAWCSGVPIHAAQVPPEESLVVFGTAPYYRELVDGTMSVIHSLYFSCGDLRRSGSAALDLCYVAAGRADGFFEARLSPWDYAAASVVVEEAGGFISSLPPLALDFQSKTPVIAGSPAVYGTVLAAAQAAEGLL